MDNIKKIKLSKNEFEIFLDNSSLKLNYILEPQKFVIDITNLSLIKAVQIAILTSTYCFINNFKKKLCWVVADEEIKRAISILRLTNIEQRIKTNVNELELAS